MNSSSLGSPMACTAMPPKPNVGLPSSSRSASQDSPLAAPLASSPNGPVTGADMAAARPTVDASSERLETSAR